MQMMLMLLLLLLQNACGETRGQLNCFQLTSKLDVFCLHGTGNLNPLMN